MPLEITTHHCPRATSPRPTMNVDRVFIRHAPVNDVEDIPHRPDGRNGPVDERHPRAGNFHLALFGQRSQNRPIACSGFILVRQIQERPCLHPTEQSFSSSFGGLQDILRPKVGRESPNNCLGMEPQAWCRSWCCAGIKAAERGPLCSRMT